jgi:hypothetical protein
MLDGSLLPHTPVVIQTADHQKERRVLDGTRSATAKGPACCTWSTCPR